MPRVLSQCDTNQMSSTYGCFDRNYWQYKRVDIPFARLQEAVLPLVLLYTNKHPQNKYYRNRKILSLIDAGIKYWCELQHSDGSFSDYYPNERAVVVTAFSLYAVTETLYQQSRLIDAKVMRTIRKSCKFLTENQEKEAVNQEIASTTALASANRLLRSEHLSDVIKNKTQFFLKNQSPEGWFKEYGGFDIGYLSVAVEHLTQLFKITNNKELVEPIRCALKFLTHFMHPDGSAGGEYSSRNTQYILPGAIELLSSIFAEATAIKEHQLKAIRQGNATTLSNLDDRYMILYLASYIEAYFMKTIEKPATKLPYEKKPFTRLFRHAGAYLKKTKNYYSILGLTTGGVLKVFKTDGSHYYSDCGIIAKYEGKTVAQATLGKRKLEVYKNKVVVSGWLHKVNYLKPTTAKHMALRVVSSAPALAKRIRKAVRAILLSKGKPVRAKVRRTVLFEEGSIKVVDEIRSAMELTDIRSLDTFNYRYIPSAQYHNAHDLITASLKHRNGKNLRIIKTFNTKNGEISCHEQ